MDDLSKIADKGIDYTYTIDIKTGIYYAIGLTIIVFATAIFYNYLNKK